MLKKYENKFILLDTNVIIYATKYPDSFKDFFDNLSKYNIKPGIDESIKLEFLRTSDTPNSLKTKEEHLELLFGSTDRLELNIDDKSFKDAKEISILYNFLKKTKKGKNKKKNKGNISAVDSLIATQLKKYKKSDLLLATVNNKDFTIDIFDRVCIYNIEVLDDIYNLGVYKFSDEKYNKVLEEFKKFKER